jgi:hypothetical protein
VPAAAVIPAPIAYIKVVAVKKHVVELWVGGFSLTERCALSSALVHSGLLLFSLLSGAGAQDFYFEKIRVFKASFSLNTLAWDNKIRLWFYFVGF